MPNRLKALAQSSMFRYIIRRLLYMIPVAVGISIIAFITMYAAGNPLDLIRIGKPNIDQTTLNALSAYYGLDKPIPIQYLNWVNNILHLNFGKSLYGGQPVNTLIGPEILPTMELQIISLLIAFAISIPIAVHSARKPYSKQDLTVTSFSLFGVSMPTFWFGLLLIIVFSFDLGWLPSAGAKGAAFLWWGNPVLDVIAHFIMPVIVLVYVSLAQNIRLIRANMLEVLRSDYILAARASGISDRKVVYRYALRNAVTPAVTFLAIALGGMLAGAPMTEYVFSWPGLGRQYVVVDSCLGFSSNHGNYHDNNRYDADSQPHNGYSLRLH